MSMSSYNFACLARGFVLAIPLICVAQTGVTAASAAPEVTTVTVPFSDPSRPGLLKIDLLSGSITVSVHAKPDVVFEYSSSPPERNHEGHEENDLYHALAHELNKTKLFDRADRESDGMFVIKNNAFSFEVTENDNVMNFEMDSWMKQRVSINVKVPVNTSLKLESVNNGDLRVEGVTGDVELSSVNGSIEATGISGTVVAETVNGSVKVVFDKITPDRFMAFSTHNGVIDVTFPPDVKADVFLDTEMGTIYSDFKIELERSAVVVSEDKDERGTRIKVDKQMRGTLNGGGPEIRFETYNGSIYIRSSAGRESDR